MRKNDIRFCHCRIRTDGGRWQGCQMGRFGPELAWTAPLNQHVFTLIELRDGYKSSLENKSIEHEPA